MTIEAVPPAPESASQRRRAEGQRNDATVLRALAAAGDAGLRGPEVAARSGLPERTARATVARLKRLGLVAQDGQRASVRATMAGRSQVGARTPGLALAGALQAAVDHFPATAQQAFVRLLLSGIVARHHLCQVHPEGWPSFIAAGRTKAGKSSMAKIACRVFDIEPGAVFMLKSKRPGEVMGRSQQTTEGWVFNASRLLGLPFVCMDEFARADKSMQQEAGQLLFGQTVVEMEAHSVQVSPLAMVTLNVEPPKGLAGLDDAFVRRSVVLNTDALGGLTRNIDVAMKDLFESDVIPHLNLSKLGPLSALSRPWWDRLRELLAAGLTQEGSDLADAEAISRLVPGRVALMGTNPHLEQACLATALDYLIVTETIPGHVRPGAVRELSAALGADVPLMANAETHLSQQATVASSDQAQKVAKAQESLAFEDDRERGAADLTQLVDRLGRRRDPEASGVKKALRESAHRMRRCRSRDALAVEMIAARNYREKAEAVLTRWEAEAQRAEQAKRDREAQREQAAWNRRQAAIRRGQEQRDAKERRAAEKKARMQWATALRVLYRMTPYASLGAALDGLVKAGWLETKWRSAPPGSGWLDGLTRSGMQHLVKVPGIPGWPVGSVVDQSTVGDFWAVACIHAERQAGSAKAGQRPVWQSTLAVKLARENAALHRKMGW